MKKLKLLCLIMISGLILYGCDYLLSYEPEQAISSGSVYSTSENVVQVLVGGYDALASGTPNDNYGGGPYSGYYMLMTDLLADAGYVNFDGTFETLRNLYLKQQTVTNYFIEGLWIDFYSVINISNNVLASLEVVDADIRDRVEGGAKFLRGVAYFELVRAFGKPWNQGDPTQNLGVPLVLKPESDLKENAKLPRATVAEVYTQVISDLKDAKKLLPEKNAPYATTYAAAGMLSRVYLQQQKYRQAAEEANYVIESGNFQLTDFYGDAFNVVEGASSETVFGIRISQQDGENNYHTHYASQFRGGRGDITLSNKFLSLYESGSERRVINYSDAEGVRNGKYKALKDGNVAIIRLAEMYLTRAECNYRLGPGNYVGPNTPAEDLNIIRNRVGLPDITNPTLQDILEERFMELAFEGFWLHDLKRLEQSFGGFSWNDYIMVFPIPLREINANENLTQNEGYGG